MGPRFNGVEDESEPLRPGLSRLASMGPRFNGVEDLRSADHRQPEGTGLQWGHALMAWKTSPRHGQPHSKPGFNGATL